MRLRSSSSAKDPKGYIHLVMGGLTMETYLEQLNPSRLAVGHGHVLEDLLAQKDKFITETRVKIGR